MIPILLLLFAIAGAWVGFANPFWHFPPAALLLPVGLALWGALARSGKRAFFGGWLAGALAFAGCLYWIALPVHNYGYLPWWVAALCPLALGAYLGLYPALFTLFARFGVHRLPPVVFSLFLGLTWAIGEIVRGWLFTGFPWLALPSAFAPWPGTLAFLSVGGTHVVSGALVAVSCMIALFLAGRGSGRTAACGLVLGACVVGYGFTPLYSSPPQAGTFTAALVQGNVNQAQKWDPAFINGTIHRYSTLTRGAVEKGAQLSIWPETAMPFYMQEVNGDTAAVKDVARETGTAILTGAPGYILNPKDRTYDLYNRAYLIGPDGMDAGTYEKVHLVPFGEYVPLGEYLPFVQKLAEGAGDFVPGHGRTLPRTPAGRVDLALGVLICYESIFTDLAQDRVEQGANILVNISNDAWFGRSAAPLQHLDLSVLRAIEQGRWLLRGTNTGISAIIDPTGHIRARSKLFRATAVVHEAAVVQDVTLYHRVQPWIVPVLGWLWAGLVLLSIARRRRSDRHERRGTIG